MTKPSAPLRKLGPAGAAGAGRAQAPRRGGRVVLTVAAGLGLGLLAVLVAPPPPSPLGAAPAPVSPPPPASWSLARAASEAPAPSLAPAPPAAATARATPGPVSAVPTPPAAAPYRFVGRIDTGTDAGAVLFGRGRVVTVTGPGPLDDDYVVEAVFDDHLVIRHLATATGTFLPLVRQQAAGAMPQDPSDSPPD